MYDAVYCVQASVLHQYVHTAYFSDYFLIRITCYSWPKAELIAGTLVCNGSCCWQFRFTNWWLHAAVVEFPGWVAWLTYPRFHISCHPKKMLVPDVAQQLGESKWSDRREGIEERGPRGIKFWKEGGVSKLLACVYESANSSWCAFCLWGIKCGQDVIALGSLFPGLPHP